MTTKIKATMIMMLKEMIKVKLKVKTRIKMAISIKKYLQEIMLRSKLIAKQDGHRRWCC